MSEPPKKCPECGRSGYADMVPEYVGGPNALSNIGEDGHWVELYYTCSCGCKWAEYYRFEKWKLTHE